MRLRAEYRRTTVARTEPGLIAESRVSWSMLTRPVPVPSSIMPGSIESTASKAARLMAGR